MKIQTQKEKTKNLHTISFLVANKPGVLVRVAQVFARRGFNIDSLVVSPAHNPKYSRMTITAQGNLETLDQIIKQCNKLVDVLHATEHFKEDAVVREMTFMKVRFKKTNKAAILKLMHKYHCHAVDETEESLIIEQTGTTQELDQFENLMKKYRIVEMVRTGKVVMARGKEPT